MLQQALIACSLLWPPSQAAFSLSVFAVSASASAKVDATQIVEKVQNFYAATNQLSAKFRQVYTNTAFGTKSQSDGRVFIKKQGKMRWDYYKKNPKTGALQVEKSFLSDGTMLWAVEHDNKQFFRKPIKDNVLPVAITFLYGEGDLNRDFQATLDTSGTYGSKLDIVLKLAPKKPSIQIKALWLVVQPERYRVKSSVILEQSGNTNQFIFYSPEFKKTVKDSWFVLKQSELLKRRYKRID